MGHLGSHVTERSYTNLIQKQLEFLMATFASLCIFFPQFSEK